MKLQLPKYQPRIPFQEKLFFTKHLATMVKAGVPIAEALETLMEQTKNPTFKKILGKIVASIKNGESLTNALQNFPAIFDAMYISLIRVGEESGTLEKNLDFLAKQLAKDYSLRQKIQAALLYPGLVLVSTTLMGGFISIFVLPKLVDFFEAFNFPLPLSTKILLFVANMMKDYGLWIISGLAIFIILFNLFIQLPPIKPFWHALILKLPIFGKLLAYNELAKFSRNFGVLMQSGVPVNHSLEITATTLTNLKFSRHVLTLSKSLEKGQSLHEVLSQKQFDEFPGIVAKMVGVGEKTGSLDMTLLYLGDFYEEEIDAVSKNLSTVLEPVLLLGIGLIVGFVALAIISPIYQLTGSIRSG